MGPDRIRHCADVSPPQKILNNTSVCETRNKGKTNKNICSVWSPLVICHPSLEWRLWKRAGVWRFWGYEMGSLCSRETNKPGRPERCFCWTVVVDSLPLVLACFWCTDSSDWCHNQTLAVGKRGDEAELGVTGASQASEGPCQGCVNFSPCLKVRSSLPLSLLY